MIKGWKKLNKDERRHLHECNCNQINIFQRNIDFQAEQERKTGVCQCWDCKVIARKLGVEPVGGWDD